ncbi:hypothetical protein Tco_0525088 [Tanacetum coccineum]
MEAAITITPRTSPPPAHPTKQHHSITTILAVTAVQTAQWVLAAIRVRLVSSAEGALGLVLNPFKQGLRLVIKTAARAAFG